MSRQEAHETQEVRLTVGNGPRDILAAERFDVLAYVREVLIGEHLVEPYEPPGVALGVLDERRARKALLERTLEARSRKQPVSQPLGPETG